MNLLFVANFDRQVGYAWNTIDPVYRRVGAALAGSGVQTFICYPSNAAPASSDSTYGAPAQSLTFDYSRTRVSVRALLAFIRLLRRHRIGVLYLTDLENWSWRYPLFHLAGVRHIVVHDRTSGERDARGGVLGVLKRALHRIPTLAADCFIGVSDFVARRLITVGAARSRVHRVYNGIDLARFAGGPDGYLQDQLGVPRETRVVFASGRAQTYKGIDTVIDAAARLPALPGVAYAYCGDGPSLDAFRRRAEERGLGHFYFLGRRDDVPRLLRSAAVAVVPSLWAEAFGLTVVEAMAAGVPVIATRVGGIPEIVTDEGNGILVPPGDVTALAAALERLLGPGGRERCAALSANGVGLVRERFSIDGTVAGLTAILTPLVRGGGATG